MAQRHCISHTTIVRYAMTSGTRLLCLTALSCVAWCRPEPLRAEVPCDFKGVSVGDKLTPRQLMIKLGIEKFVSYPQQDIDWALVEKYGIIAASEIEDEKIGPYCQLKYCRVPYGISVGNDDMPVSVFVSFNAGTITEIDVGFNAAFWDDVLAIIKKKYGFQWTAGRVEMAVTDLETKKSELMQREIVENRSVGVNLNTKDTCHMWATYIDIVFRHHDNLGPLHSVFIIKPDSKNF